MPDPNLMSREEVAALLGIKPNSVRDTLRRYGITEQRGYPREAVENLQRPKRGYRTDLHGAFMPNTEHLPELFEQGLKELRRQAEEAGKAVGAYLVELVETNRRCQDTDLNDPAN